MAKLIYAPLLSLDGYVNDVGGRWDWAFPDEDVHRAANELMRPVGTQLYGRRMYEVMQAWETIDDPAPAMRDFAALWRASEKVVYSTTLAAPATPRTRIERSFDPEAVRALKAAAGADLAVSGADLAGQALRAGLVDELHLLVFPVIVGGGTRALPDGAHLPLALVGERRFGNGVVQLDYTVGAT
jgi:dihydrofolate reductase